MIEGKLVNVRLMRASDIEKYHELHENVSRRGPYYPTNPMYIASLSQINKQYSDYGLWDPLNRFSVLLITDKSDRLVGEVDWLPERKGIYEGYEIGWFTFEPEDRGKGYATEAVQHVVHWMFDGIKINRMEAYIHPDNVASQRVAEKCGFTHEATLREMWFQHGRYHDLRLYRILRSELPVGK